MAQHDDPQEVRQINLRLPAELVERIDQLKGEFGLRSRGRIVERLLRHLLTDPDGDALDPGDPGLEPGFAVAAKPPAQAVPLEADRLGDQLGEQDPVPAPESTPGSESQSAAAAPVPAVAAEQLVHQPTTAPAPETSPPPAMAAPPAAAGVPGSSGCFDESSALVLVTRAGSMELVLDLDLLGAGRRSSAAHRDDDAHGAGAGAGSIGRGRGSGRGIDLPGFVQRRSDQLRQSLHPRRSTSATVSDPLPTVAADRLEQALDRACGHWMELYGGEPNEAVLEASMIWLAQDIWPQSDQCEGRPFSWSLVQQVMTGLCPAWPLAPASFGRVMVAAGVLEDPFSASTLELRIPTLIRRFVHRFRRRRPGASFQTLEHTMTLHGALRLLQLPTTPGQRLTLPQIREAYRDMALAHHPDAGGSEEAMRRLNEAYQLLKELYRTA